METYKLADPSKRLTSLRRDFTKLKSKMNGGRIMWSKNIYVLIVLSTAGAIGLSSVLGKPIRSEGASKSKVIQYTDLGEHTRSVATSSLEAQKYFDQGLAFMYAYNHDEAIRAFQRAAEL